MTMETTDLDRLQEGYRQAVDEWVAKIREEESFAASADHSLVSLDEWEKAGLQEGMARERVKAAKKEYEDALRQRYFGF